MIFLHTRFQYISGKYLLRFATTMHILIIDFVIIFGSRKIVMNLNDIGDKMLGLVIRENMLVRFLSGDNFCYCHLAT